MPAKKLTIGDEVAKQKVAIYIRVSTHWQIDKDSLKVQRRELIAYSQMILGIDDYEIFEDPGYSAKNTDRPEYQRMMSQLRTGRYSHLLVWKIDRISRNLLDFSQMYKELKDLGITFVSKNEQFDTSTAIGEAMLKIILVFAELERNMTSERVSAVMVSRANNGQWNGGRIPFGYSYDKKESLFSIVESEAAIVNEIYNMYEVEQSVVKVTKRLNDAGLYNRSGKEWNAVGVHKILRNPFYYGTYVYGKRSYKDGNDRITEPSEWIIVDDHHIPIITKEKFDRIQFLLKRNGRGGWADGEVHSRDNIHIFAGLLRCGKCGSNMTATPSRRRADGWRPSMYGCATRRKSTKKCDNKYVQDVTLGPFVFSYIQNIIKARKSITSKTTTEQLERKLLRGDTFILVESINEEALKSTLELFRSGQSGIEYKPAIVFESTGTKINEKEFLQNRYSKLDTALRRLKALYLYGDKEYTEGEYIAERQKILDELTDVEKQLAAIQANESEGDFSDESFEDKAAYFMLVDKLLNDRFFNYEKYIRSIDSSIPQSFLRLVVQSIEVTDGYVTAIQFKNGLTHKFRYKQI